MSDNAEYYNVKLLKYKNGVQLRTYDRAIKTKFKKEEIKVTDELAKKVQSNELHVRTKKEEEHSLHCSMARTVQNIYGYALSNHWDWFVTFTFNPRIIDSTQYDECVFALHNWLHNVKQRTCRNMVYLVVPEFHSDKCKFHFHVLMSNIEQLTFVDSFRRQKDTNKEIYNIYEYRFGYTTAIRVDKDAESQSKCCGYMLKYITKDLVSLTAGKRRYWVSTSTIKKPVIKNLMLSADDVQALQETAKMSCEYAKTINVPIAGNMIHIYDM